MFSRGERDIGRADLHRHDDIGKANEQRGREQEQHDRAVHGEELVVHLFVDELQAWLGELGADDQRHHAADQEEAEGRDQVHLADHLVIGCRQHPSDRPPQLPPPRCGGGPGACGDPGLSTNSCHVDLPNYRNPSD
ncbi:hypothetical protein GCM10010522_23910 [Kribbella solani]|uniref:Uncharacterized protein n=1 Tax=Kribbella solani TaxID=236067 RepID=A0A841DK77_9ACTN|nr:hypothetical protein [Kribbella solani]